MIKAILDDLEQRETALNEQIEQLKMQYNVLIGRRAEVQRWLEYCTDAMDNVDSHDSEKE